MKHENIGHAKCRDKKAGQIPKGAVKKDNDFVFYPAFLSDESSLTPNCGIDCSFCGSDLLSHLCPLQMQLINHSHKAIVLRGENQEAVK